MHHEVYSLGPIKTDLANIPFTMSALVPIVLSPGKIVTDFVSCHSNINFRMYIPQMLGDSTLDCDADTLSTMLVLAVLVGYIRRRQLCTECKLVNAELAMVDENICMLQEVTVDAHLYIDFSNSSRQNKKYHEVDLQQLFYSIYLPNYF